MTQNGVPGMACAIVYRGRVTATGVAGVRKRGSPEPATLQDRWHLGSCTKAMTATLVAILAADGVLSFDTTLAEGLTGKVAHIHPEWRSVTLDMLLHNFGGAPADLTANGLWARLWRCKGSPTEARLMLAEGVLAHPPPTKPGTKHVYSNAGFALVGAVIESKTGKAWESLMQERLWGPLGIKSGSFGAPGTIATDGRPDEPRGHNADGTPVEPGPGSDNPVAIGPAGTAAMTIQDWARFVALHVEGETTEGAASPLLPPQTIQQLHTPLARDEARYAMGWIVTDRPWAGGRTLTHSGSNTMWYCSVWLAPSRHFAILATANQGGESGRKACDEAVAALIKDHQAHEGQSSIDPTS